MPWDWIIFIAAGLGFVVACLAVAGFLAQLGKRRQVLDSDYDLGLPEREHTSPNIETFVTGMQMNAAQGPSTVYPPSHD